MHARSWAIRNTTCRAISPSLRRRERSTSGPGSSVRSTRRWPSPDQRQPQCSRQLSIVISSPTSRSPPPTRRASTVLAELQGDFEKQHGGAATKAHAASYRKAQRMIETEARGGSDWTRSRQAPRPPTAEAASARVLAGASTGGARRAVRRSHPRRLGYASEQLRSGQDPQRGIDPAFATLLSDLKDRGMLANTTRSVDGRFGGRAHQQDNWPRPLPVAWSTVLAGAGVKGGQAVAAPGRTGRRSPSGRSQSPTS